jgi:hypothetical protein
MTTYTPSSDNVTFGRGRVLFSPFVNGAYTGQFKHLGNCDTFSIGLAPEKIQLTDVTQETSAPYKEVVKKTDMPIKISGFEFASFNMKLAFMGSETSYTQTAATLTETLAAASLTGLKGSFFRTAKKSITINSVVQGTSTLVSGTDYEAYDSAGGVVRVIPTSPTVADGTALSIVYTAAAITATPRTQIVGGAVTSLSGRLVFLPQNTTGPANEVVVWNASITPDGDIPFIGDDWLKWNLSGSVQSDAAGTYGGSAANPYFYVETR